MASRLTLNPNRTEKVMIGRITRDELQAKLEHREAVVLLEALPPRYFLDKHLPGAFNLPHDQVDALAPGLLPDSNTEIVVYCANTACRNSHLAAAQLAKLGYAHVSVYHEGKQDWVEAGLPIETGETSASAA
jgi:rhodanese-related sulfurtransferase